jgi:hypothetical protein
MLPELKSVLVLSCRIEFVSIHDPISPLSGQNWIRLAPIKNRYQDTADCLFHRFI